MLESGMRIEPPEGAHRSVDKHSTGGVGDKLSFLVAPLVAAAGVPVPMISGRSLGHTGGTLDKLESIPGYRTDLEPEEFRELVVREGLSITGQSERLVPADRLLYALRDAASIVESVPLITASILSKKVAEGARALVLDVKVGSGAFMSDLERARALARQLVGTAAELGLEARAYLTRMDRVLGRTAGNALEIRESIEALRDGPASASPDVRALTLALGAGMLELAGAAHPEESERRIEQLWTSGAGLERFRALVAAHGGDAAVVDDPTRLPAALRTVEVEAGRAGTFVGLAARASGTWIAESGGGRLAAGAAVDPTIGIEILVEPGDRVEASRIVARLHDDGEADEEGLRERARSWIRMEGDPHAEREAAASSPILEIIDRG
jgi:pyrimidine-nucleoside phosphorylase